MYCSLKEAFLLVIHHSFIYRGNVQRGFCMCVKEEHRIGNALQSLVDNYVDPSVNG